MNTLVKPKHTNDLGYQEIDADHLTPLQDFILCTWEFLQDNLKVGKYVLARPDTHKKQHYTGTVLALGPDVDPVIKVGDRIIFDQFSNFEKYWDEKYGRIAMLQECMQGCLFAVVPKRVLVEGQEPDYDFNI